MSMSIEQRVAALERANKRYRLLLACVMVSACGLGLMGFGRHQVPDKIQAKNFEVLNDEGKVMVRISTFEGDGVVTTYKPSGEILADILATKSGAGGIVLYDGAGKQNLVFTDVSGGGGSVRVNNSKGQTAVLLGRNGNQAGSMTIKNQNEKSILLFTGDTAEAGAIIAYDNDGKQTGRVPGG